MSGLTPERLAALRRDATEDTSVNVSSAQLLALLDALEQRVDPAQTDEWALRMEREVERLTKALREYGRHWGYCEGYNMDQLEEGRAFRRRPCTCGLTDALNAVAGRVAAPDPEKQP